MTFVKRKTLFGILLLVLGSAPRLSADDRHPNVLFIAADDLRCDLGCYGHPLVKTPNIDRLAEQGVQFDRAYCQQALCNPSRASLMTGRRPDQLRIWNLTVHFRERFPEIVTLPQQFQNHGYFTQNIGKIYHNWRTEIKGDPLSWSVPAVLHFGTHGDDKPQVTGELPPNHARDPKCECRDVPDDAYYDGRIADLAIKALQERKQAETPFFLAVGFWKPHSPFNAPKKYWDLYEREDIKPPQHPEWPENAPEIAWHNSRELLGTPARELTPAAVAEIRHGYLAAISYLDTQVGKLLTELDRLGLRDNTIVVFWSDHGYHLGEQSLWAKTSNFELDAHVPLIISAPGMKGNGHRTRALVELLDMYPTLVDLCELSAVDNLAGESLKPILHDPSASVKEVAITQHPRPAYYRNNQMDAMGHSLRTDRYRYTQWRHPESGKLVGQELYDHENDPHETRNVAEEAEYEETVGTLERLFKFTAIGPP
ncbi:MAG: sulfatase [Planctomycetaceae bacterium]|nr:sulfatase [Planctomycetaceae bacterium]